jgi:hypothetical protein
MCALFETHATDEDDIEKYIRHLEKCWQKIEQYNSKKLKVHEDLFMGILLTSLPPFWDDFIHPFMSNNPWMGTILRITMISQISPLTISLAISLMKHTTARGGKSQCKTTKPYLLKAPPASPSCNPALAINLAVRSPVSAALTVSVIDM